MTDVAAVGRRVEALLDEIAGADPEVAATASEVVRAVSELYGEGLARLVSLLDEPTLRRVTADELVTALLVLHDLHPDDLVARVTSALESVRPALGSHAGGVDLIGIEDEPDGAVVRLRLAGSCHGCPSSLITTQQAIERAVLSAAPEVVRIEVDGVTEEPEPQLLQIQPMRRYAEDGSDCPAVVGAPS